MNADYTPSVKSRMAELSMCQRKLSALTGMSIATVNKVINDPASCNLGSIIRILDLLGLELQGVRLKG